MDQARRERLPRGILALVFTDVEGSTELWQLNEEAFNWALMEHDEEVRDCLLETRGNEVKHTGDGFFLCFESAYDAADFCLALQTRLTRHAWPPELGPVRTRIGMHVGEPKRHGRDYRGTAVNIASRVCMASHGGQILLSAAAAAALAGDPNLTALLEDLDEHALPGLLERERLFNLRCDATAGLVFPPPGQESPRPNRATAESAAASLSKAHFSGSERDAWERVRVALRQKDELAAITDLEPLLERYPDHVKLLNAAGVAYAMARNYERAEAVLRRLVELEPNHASAWFNLARVYGKMGRRDEIAPAVSRALQADPNHHLAREAARKYGIDLPEQA